MDKRYIRSVEYLASHTGSQVRDKLKAAGLNYSMGPTLPVPVIAGSAATLECRLATVRKTGDHVLISGAVVSAHASGDFRDYWQYRRYKPILYTGWQDGLTTYD